MTRTRVVKGNIAIITQGDHKRFAQQNIAQSAEGNILNQGVERGMSFNEPEQPPAKKIRAKCMVQFRPHANWRGEFGFDWVKDGRYRDERRYLVPRDRR